MVCIIDFDGTFFKNDFFLEIFLKNLIHRPFYLLKLLLKTKFKIIDIKIELFKNYKINYNTNFLINNVVLNWININRDKYEGIYLVSATPNFFLKSLFTNILVFDEIYGSNNINLKGNIKLDFIKKKWGSNFAYLGNSFDDIQIYKESLEAYNFQHNKIINVKPIYKIN
jgi:2-hydroxy-3-keto-5-methylthiopentenyl-1-phosphate phosphatase